MFATNLLYKSVQFIYWPQTCDCQPTWNIKIISLLKKTTLKLFWNSLYEIHSSEYSSWFGQYVVLLGGYKFFCSVLCFFHKIYSCPGMTIRNSSAYIVGYLIWSFHGDYNKTVSGSWTYNHLTWLSAQDSCIVYILGCHVNYSIILQVHQHVTLYWQLHKLDFLSITM